MEKNEMWRLIEFHEEMKCESYIFIMQFHGKVLCKIDRIPCKSELSTHIVVFLLENRMIKAIQLYGKKKPNANGILLDSVEM